MTLAKPLPGGWELAAVEEVAVLNPPQPDTVPEDDTLVSFVPMPAVEAGTGRLDPSQTRSWGDVKRGFTRFQENDVLFAKITPSMENGKCALAVGLVAGWGAGSTEFHVLRCSEAIVPRFLLHYMLQESFRREARSNMKGVAGQMRVSPEFIASATLPLATRPEQRRIVAEIEKHFTRLDAAVAALERSRANLKRYRAAVLKDACEGRLVPTEAELARAEGRDYEPADVLLGRILRERRERCEGKNKEPETADKAGLSDLPKAWVWASMDELLAEPLSNGRSVPNGRGFPVLRLTALKNGRIDPSEHKLGTWTSAEAEPYLIGCGDFLVSRGNGSLSLVGRGGLVPDDPPAVAYPDTLIRVRPDLGCVVPEYLRAIWDSWFVRNQIESTARTTAGIYKINQQDLRRIVLPLPPLPEQDRIVAEVERRLSVVEELGTTIERGLKRAARLRQSILKRAFEGKLVPQDPNDEPASVLLERIRAARVANAEKSSSRGRRSPRGTSRTAAGWGEAMKE